MISGNETSQKQKINAVDVVHLVDRFDALAKSYQSFDHLAQVLPVSEDGPSTKADGSQGSGMTVTEISVRLHRLDLFVTKESEKSEQPLL